LPISGFRGSSLVSWRRAAECARVGVDIVYFGSVALILTFVGFRGAFEVVRTDRSLENLDEIFELSFDSAVASEGFWPGLGRQWWIRGKSLDFGDMSGAPKPRSVNVADPDARPVLVPGGNKARSVATAQKPASKPPSKTESTEVAAADEKKKKASSPTANLPHLMSSLSAPSPLRRHEMLLQSNLSLNASCSSDASTDSFCSRASTGRIGRTSLTSKRRESISRTAKIMAKVEKHVSDDAAMHPPEIVQGKRKCAWVTPNTVKYSAEDGDGAGEIIDEFGSLDRYCWSFVNYKPIIRKFRYPRQVPVKTPKADVISKDLVRRGFRSVGPTVIYSFMQAAGLTNDHFISCFRFVECIAAAASSSKDEADRAKGRLDSKVEDKISTGQELMVGIAVELSRDGLSIS
ncbi:hypothetical protein BHE74_00026599, partial [Ensete ventricosum]